MSEEMVSKLGMDVSDALQRPGHAECETWRG